MGEHVEKARCFMACNFVALQPPKDLRSLLPKSEQAISLTVTSCFLTIFLIKL